jgi:hypothetical protein
MDGAGCKLTTLVSRSGCSVCVCGHGLVHVTIGSVTVRLPGESLRCVAAVLDEAVHELRRAEPVGTAESRPLH